MLALGRRAAIKVEPVDANASVREVQAMLGRLVGDNVEIVLDLASDVPLTCVDRSHLDQVLANLSVNARDAMASGGRPLIRTARLDLDMQLPAALATRRQVVTHCLRSLTAESELRPKP